MFDKIFIRSLNVRDNNIGVKKLIDFMLYYNEVHLIFSPSVFVTLMTTFDEDTLCELIKSKRLILHPHEMQIGCGVHPTLRNTYNIGLFSHAGIDDVHSLLYMYHRRNVVRNSTFNMRFADKFSPLMEMFQMGEQLNKLIALYIGRDNVLSEAAKKYVRKKWPLYKGIDTIEVTTENIINGIMPDAFTLNSNISITDFNNVDFLQTVASAAIDCYLTSLFESEIMTSQMISDIMRLQMNDTIARSSKSATDIDMFQTNITYDSISLGDAFINKVINGKTLLKIMERGSKFREWLQDLPDDTSLIGQYIDECNKRTKADSNLWKGIRFSLTTLIGCIPVVGNIIGTASSFVDSFMIDKWLNGWKPNMFIDDVLRPSLIVKQD